MDRDVTDALMVRDGKLCYVIVRGDDIFSGNNCYIFVIDSLFYLVTNVHIDYNVTDSGS